MAATGPQGPPEAGKPVGELTYTEASRELDAIVAFFEQREVDVDQLVPRLERATEIVGELDQRLRRTRVQVEQLVPKLASVLSEVPAHETEEDEEEEQGAAARAEGAEGHDVGAGDGHPGLF